MSDDEFPTRILHAFADYGVESEPLSAYGHVTQVGIGNTPTGKPIPNEYSEAVMADASRPEELPFEENEFDLALLHPPCTKWSRMTSIDGDPDDHKNLIPQAREIGRRYAEHYIIENRPEAPLNNPVVFDGKMFGLPIHYERAFETSFPIEQPARYPGLETEVSTYFSASRSAQWWRTAKGVCGDYPKEHLVKNCLPASYVHALARAWTKAITKRDRQEAPSNSGPAPRKVSEDQTTLEEVGNRG
jgi:hypothetical protein